MGKTTEQLNASKAGSTAESNGFGSQERPFRPAGVYQLKDEEGNIVDEQIVKSHPLFGDSQAAAFERVGYKFLRETKPGEVKEMEINPTPASGDDKEGLKGLQARMTAFENDSKAKDDEIASLKAQLAQRDSNDASVQTENNDQVVAQTATDVKQEAIAQTALRENGGSPLDDSEGDKTPEQTEEQKLVAELQGRELNKDNFKLEELQKLAAAEAVNAEGLNTKQEIVDAVQKARDEKEGE